MSAKIVLRSHRHESGFGLLKRVENTIIAQEISSEGIHPSIVAKSFAYLAGYPQDPYSPYARSFKDRIITEAGKLGIIIDVYA